MGAVTPQNVMVKHLCIFALEVSMAVGESSDLCRAHEGEVQWIEEQHNILALQADAILASTTPATVCSSLSAVSPQPLQVEAINTVIGVESLMSRKSSMHTLLVSAFSSMCRAGCASDQIERHEAMSPTLYCERVTV